MDATAVRGPADPDRLIADRGAAPTPRLAPPRPKIGDSRPAPTPDPAAPVRNGRRTGRAPAEAGRRGGAGDPASAADRVATNGGAAGGGRVNGGGANGETNGNGDGAEGGTRKRRRRGGGRGKAGADRRPVEAVLVDDPVTLDPETLEKRRGRERKGRPVGRYSMVVHVQPGATQIAVLEGRSLIEHYVSRPADQATEIDGNIYLGRVQNVLPGMEAAFVDIGTPKNAVLYRGDLRYDADDVDSDGEAAKSGKGKGNTAKDARIEQLLKGGQTVLCQVTKNPIAHKGARLTQEVSLPGRFVVLIPGSNTYGISKRLADDERKRLRKILDELRPEGHGLIVRTAAEGATPDELRRDVSRLLSQWERIDELARSSRAPKLLYREPDLAVRVIREEFNRNYRSVVIDDRTLYEEVREYVASISPELADRVEYADPEDDPLPAFERHHIHEQLHKALDRKVWLESGGSLIIERTEALTVIDVNTGKNVGSSNLEETVYRNNLEAAEEIARQLRLRDIGGIIVIDFIDMEISKNRAEVIKVFRAALARDKTRTQVFDISELGLVEMTRKRISEGLVESFSQICPTCAGRGLVIDQTLLA
jgi:ribonuclease E